ncbi:MAG: copper amine oxidase N-terminal domain-containing protein, partial [Veillonella sp.]|nr:copper amine oxidase N-terminal domain-containing protein [Veillonella sp.]
MKLKQLILSGIAVGALAFTSGMVQPAQAAVGAETATTTQSLKRPASVTTQHY